MKVNVYSEKGAKLQSKVELPKDIFGIKPNKAALRQYIRVYRINQRQGTVATKTRGEVRGGGKKPWPQKGTGRARHGSIRSPIWVGGGVAHGPRPRKFGLSIPKKIRDLALRSALSAKAAEGQVYVVSQFSPKGPKTALAAALLKKLGLEKPLIVTSKKDETVVRSFRNIPGTHVEEVTSVNPYVIVRAKNILLLQESIGVFKERLKKPIKKKVTEEKKVKPRRVEKPVKKTSKPIASASQKRVVRRKK